MNALTADRISRLNEYLNREGHIVILTHTNPDGDAIGSSSALLHYLRDARRKDVSVILPNSGPSYLNFISSDKCILSAEKDPGEAERAIDSCSLLIGMDFNGFNRVSTLEAASRRCKAPKILIDHHLNPAEEEFDLCFSETGISSASELLYWILMALPDIDGDASKLPSEALVSLMTGMTTDTNNFANSVFPSTLRMAGELLDAGVDRDRIISLLYNGYRENRVRAIATLLKDHLRILDNGTAYVVAYRDLLERFDIREGELEGLVNIPLSIGKVKMSIFLREDEGYFRVSIRSKKGTSANNMAREHFNGGGHEQAAGGRLYFPQDIKSPLDAEEYIKKVTG